MDAQEKQLDILFLSFQFAAQRITNKKENRQGDSANSKPLQTLWMTLMGPPHPQTQKSNTCRARDRQTAMSEIQPQLLHLYKIYSVN